MPLIEAFLAFALTMLAFATAVSAVVGVWLRVFRWRAAGLASGATASSRSMMIASAARLRPLSKARAFDPGM